jgi:hypothetical protein
MMQFPAGASNQKIRTFWFGNAQVPSTQMNPLLQKGWLHSVSIVCAAGAGFLISLVGQEKPLTTA